MSQEEKLVFSEIKWPRCYCGFLGRLRVQYKIPDILFQWEAGSLTQQLSRKILCVGVSLLEKKAGLLQGCLRHELSGPEQ